jgi:mannose-1-phosphate guanylyltransferase/mannose-6-phosphate isomerase
MSNTTSPHISFRPVILCGGSGTRLWPLSRAGFPKQFLRFTSQKTLFQESVERLLEIQGALSPLIVCNEEHRFLVRGQLDDLANLNPRVARLTLGASLVLEPEGRNTAPALTLAAFAALEDTKRGSLMVITPADQNIKDKEAFQKSIGQALLVAEGNTIVTLGVTPTRPETGYGYMKVDTTKSINSDLGARDSDNHSCFNVIAFTEKPSLEKAQNYLSEGNYFWNAGMFILDAQVWLTALRKHRPDILTSTNKSWIARKEEGFDTGKNESLKFIRPDKLAFLGVPAQSIDYAVMEPSSGSSPAIKLVPLQSDWSDLGAWDAVWEALAKDDRGNSQSGDVITMNCENTLVIAGKRLVGLLDVKNIVVIETEDAVLITDRESSQNVKLIVEDLKARKRQELELHRKVHRPWGWYDSIDEGERFKVKRIQVKPGASLSLQKHHHRAEHWIVVKGTAEITVGEQVLLLSENQSTFIPLGEVHRLANPGTIPLEIIEVQSGSYLGEDDIVRFEDVYGREKP